MMWYHPTEKKCINSYDNANQVFFFSVKVLILMENGPSPITRLKTTYTTNPKKKTSPQANQKKLMGQRPNTQTTRHPTTSAGLRVEETGYVEWSGPSERHTSLPSPLNRHRLETSPELPRRKTRYDGAHKTEEPPSKPPPFFNA